jgi:hydroxymethylbilane synthase
MNPLRIGSRGSALAIWQAEFVRDWLKARGASVEIMRIRTSGDQFQQGSVTGIGLKGVFIKEIEDALLSGSVDLAVHSLKDMPTEIPSGLEIAAIPPREDPRDCLISRDERRLAELPAGARIGTSSLRRAAQLRHFRADLEVAELRGNVDTRLRKVQEGAFDAVVVARAGVKRLGHDSRITEVLEPSVMLPAVGQGALAIEIRSANPELAEQLAEFDHPETRTAISAERAVLAALEGGCQVPLGAWARIESGNLVLDACVCAPDGSEVLRERGVGPAMQPELLGRAVAQRLRTAGADRLLRLVGR